MSTIKEIRNLSSGKYIFKAGINVANGDGTAAKPFLKADEFVPGESGKFGYAKNLDFTTKVEFPVAKFFSYADDNIQVTWENGRAAGGRIISTAAKTFSIIELEDYSRVFMEVKGQMEIGKPDGPAAVTLSVRAGNMHNDTIINFSDQEDGANPSKINITDLIAWLGGKSDTPEKDIALPAGPDDAPDKPKPSFSVEFKKLYFNVTRKSFNIHVESDPTSSLTIGPFTLKSVSLKITNEALPLPEPTDE